MFHGDKHKEHRKSEEKEMLTVYDISDDLRYKSHTNHTYNHMKSRLKIYKNENFNYNVKKINLKEMPDDTKLL